MMEERRRHSRAQSEIRSAFIYLDSRAPLLDCEVINVSDGGARIRCKTMLPTHFMLFWRQDGSDRRACKVMWRDGLEVGVAFE
jgi:hypothetical protein